MNRQNFDTDSVGNYPLTIDRLAEAQDDWQAPMKILAGLLPSGNCIIAGCESKGAAGWVRMVNENGQPEVFEVHSGSSYDYLKIVDTGDTLTAENSDGDSVTVRVERYLEWNLNATGTYCTWAELPRMRVRTTAQDDEGWAMALLGDGWVAATNGSKLKVQHIGGRVHLYGDMVFPADVIIGGNVHTSAFLLPGGYRPAGDVLVPIRYKGTVACAILGSDGFLSLPVTPENGDTLKIDTYIEL